MSHYTFALFTNTYNPHMAPLAEELYALLGDKFVFIALETLDEERKKLGWSDKTEPYVRYYAEAPTDCQNIIDTVPTLYFGANPNMFEYVRTRLDRGLLTFFHMERILKHGLLQFFLPQYTRYYIEQRIRPSKLPHVYFLACSAYLKQDLKRLRACTERTVRFGYFPKLYALDLPQVTKARQQDGKVVILCGGRMLKLKHIDDIVRAVAAAQKCVSTSLELRVMGNGPEEENLKQLVEQLGLQDTVKFIGPLTPEQVRVEMMASDVFVAASDKREGWGVVINEAMNSGCAVIASHTMGAVPYLMQENNGCVFPSGDVARLTQEIVRLAEDEALRTQIGEKAYRTIDTTWNARVAAQRLVAFSEAIAEGKTLSWDDGPMSR